ncbi:hypothetical protein ACJEKH_26280, partial [Escherichia coli]
MKWYIIFAMVIIALFGLVSSDPTVKAKRRQSDAVDAKKRAGDADEDHPARRRQNDLAQKRQDAVSAKRRQAD